MKLIKSEKFNPNYLAKIVNITDFTKHPNPDCTGLKCAHVGGYSISVSKDTPEGLYVYFPIGVQINGNILSFLNLYRKAELNKDQDKTGFFDENGRVKAIKLQKYPSEGFLLPVEALQKCFSEEIEFEDGLEFDSIELKNGTDWICKKYIVKQRRTQGSSNRTKAAKQPKGLDKLVENQFRLHYDTVLIKKNPYAVKPDDIISVTAKVHGTSGISSLVICKKSLSFKDRLIGFLFGKDKVSNLQYDDLWSSRKVVKNRFYNSGANDGYYGVDVWGEAHKILKPHLTKGLTLYYEIIGFLPNGGAIQSLGGQAYDYGCIPPGENEPYTYNKHFKIQIYRVTYTNPDGIVYEFSAKQVQQWCNNHGLTPVQELYYGYAKDLYPDLDLTTRWNENFIQRMADDKNFYMEELSPTCHNKVPHEGVVIKVENSKSEAYKLKCFRFLEKESKAQDKGESNIEDDE